MWLSCCLDLPCLEDEEEDVEVEEEEVEVEVEEEEEESVKAHDSMMAYLDERPSLWLQCS